MKKGEEEGSKLVIEPQEVYMKWCEYKPRGKNLLRRSFHSCVIHKQNIYIYGGYEANAGILSDFQCIAFPSQNQPFEWKQVGIEGNETPGPLRNHTAFVYNDKMYLFGGKQTSLTNTGNLWVFDFNSLEWALESHAEYHGEKISVEGHSSIFVEELGLFISFGGFYSLPIGGYTSVILCYDVKSKVWSTLFDCEQQETKNKPRFRAGAGLTYANGCLYIFGGTNVEVKYDDFWCFNIEQKAWSKIESQNGPESRSSPTLIKHPSSECLVLFGGIHDITHEKNDLCIFHLEKKEWRVIEEDNSHKLTNDSEQKAIERSHSDEELNLSIQEKVSSKQMKNTTKVYKPLKRTNLSTVNQSIQSSEIQPSGNNMEELKKKRWLQKKMNMLQEFELDDTEKKNFRCQSPTTDQMKNSISVCQPGENLKNNHSPDKGPSKDHKGTSGEALIVIKGKKPCARDGHSSIVYKNSLVIIGGDRHLMSFNDLYVLQLNDIKLN